MRVFSQINNCQQKHKNKKTKQKTKQKNKNKNKKQTKQKGGAPLLGLAKSIY